MKYVVDQGEYEGADEAIQADVIRESGCGPFKGHKNNADRYCTSFWWRFRFIFASVICCVCKACIKISEVTFLL